MGGGRGGGGMCRTYSIHMVNEDRPDEVVLPLVLLAQGGSLLLGILDQALNEVGAALTDNWSDGTVVLQASPHYCVMHLE